MVDAKDDHNRTPLHDAALYGNREAVEILLERGALVDAKEDDNRTPLHGAISTHQNLSIIRALVEAGADINMECDRVYHPSSNALGLAKYYKNEEVYRLLQELGAEERHVGTISRGLTTSANRIISLWSKS